MLQSDEAFKIYLTCLQNLEQTAEISTAAQKRDALLAGETVAAASVPAAEAVEAGQVASETLVSTSTTDATQPPVTDATQTPITNAASTLTPSQVIAQQVLAQSGASRGLQTPLATNGPTDPIQVTIVERKSALSGHGSILTCLQYQEKVLGYLVLFVTLLW